LAQAIQWLAALGQLQFAVTQLVKLLEVQLVRLKVIAAQLAQQQKQQLIRLMVAPIGLIMAEESIIKMKVM
jgi:hypothetical protein